jgi:hypothetical protein
LVNLFELYDDARTYQRQMEVDGLCRRTQQITFYINCLCTWWWKKNSFRNLLCLNKTERRCKRSNVHLKDHLIRIFVSAPQTHLSEIFTCETTSRISKDYKSLYRNIFRCIRESSAVFLIYAPYFRPIWIFFFTTVGRTPLDEWSARYRNLYLTTLDTHNRQIYMRRVGFERAI